MNSRSIVLGALSLGLLGSAAPAQLCTGADHWVCNLDQIYEGDTPFNHRGYSLSASGDWNDDGRNDILAGSFRPWDVDDPSDLPSSVAVFQGHALGAYWAAGRVGARLCQVQLGADLGSLSARR